MEIRTPKSCRSSRPDEIHPGSYSRVPFCCNRSTGLGHQSNGKAHESLCMAGFIDSIWGQCIVAWKKVCRPPELGGLGIHDLTLQVYSLQLRWEWLKRTDTCRTWVTLPAHSELIVQKFFAASVTSIVGNGHDTKF